MKASILARKIHKWVALIVGIQVLFWMLSGVYMTIVNIDFIHGDSLVRNLEETLPAIIPGLHPIADVVNRYPQAASVTLESRRALLYYVVRYEKATELVDAVTGRLASPISQDHVTALATYYYAGEGIVSDVVLLTDEEQKPQEIQSRSLPIWQVTFDDRIDTTFYLSPSTGEMLTRRHSFWRLYDFLWMFHIMDYENRSDINNNLIRVASFVGLMMALSGLWLLVHSLRGRRVTKKNWAAETDQTGRNYGPIPKTS